MTWISNLTTAFGLVLLAHACYSAQEYTTFQSLRSSTGSTTPTTSTLPVDITIETIASLLITSLGLVWGTNSLWPIEWHVWAGKIEREGGHKLKGSSDDMSKDIIGNPFRFLETRPGFVDIRRQRKEFGDWARTSGGEK